MTAKGLRKITFLFKKKSKAILKRIFESDFWQYVELKCDLEKKIYFKEIKVIDT